MFAYPRKKKNQHTAVDSKGARSRRRFARVCVWECTYPELYYRLGSKQIVVTGPDYLQPGCNGASTICSGATLQPKKFVACREQIACEGAVTTGVSRHSR